MMLSGEYVTLNSHWEDWNLPKWYHPERKLNLTTIARVNALAKGGPMHSYEVSASNNTALHTPQSSTSQNTVNADSVKQNPKVEDESSGIQSRQVQQQTFPRFPDEHPLSQELHRLQSFAAVIHFSAMGKPWSVTDDTLRQQRPDAHPLLGEQFRAWRTSAAEICPGYRDSYMTFSGAG